MYIEVVVYKKSQLQATSTSSITYYTYLILILKILMLSQDALIDICNLYLILDMLIDISDVLQICCYELGRTYMRLSQALCINIPSIGK